MKIGTRARYSLRLTLAIAKLSEDGSPVTLHQVADHCGLSSRYLGQLVTPLKNARLLLGRTGPGGGYVLARSPRDVRLIDVVEAAIGPIAIVDCALEAEECLHGEFCNCQGLWALVNRRIRESLEEFSLADLLSDGWTKRIRTELASLT